jgi:hypothetical protein
MCDPADVCGHRGPLTDAGRVRPGAAYRPITVLLRAVDVSYLATASATTGTTRIDLHLTRGMPLDQHRDYLRNCVGKLATFGWYPVGIRVCAGARCRKRLPRSSTRATEPSVPRGRDLLSREEAVSSTSRLSWRSSRST